LVELSSLLGASGTTVLRALRVLEASGFIRRGGDGTRYYLGMRLAELGQAAVASLDIIEMLKPTMIELSRRYAVTAHAGMLRAGMITVVDKIDPPIQRVRYSSLGSRMPLHATAAGKSVMALQNPDMPLELPDELEAYTSATICNREELRREIIRTREDGFGTESGEYQVGFSCVGVAFRCFGEVYTLSLSGHQIGLDDLNERGRALADVLQTVLAHQIPQAQTASMWRMR
jgi:DNA-binding IclR family transcriptional regulator